MRCTTMTIRAALINLITNGEDYSHVTWFNFSETELDFRKSKFFSPSQQNHLIGIEIFTLLTSALLNYCAPLFIV